ncbi:helix-turn-helix transcriptional regulator [Staphylococcus saprophyticus]|nr:helix-turn-helix transcriptional regulator [Staphylococcus saprophyticus]MDW4234711.1 helix-turn-helix transcriptional regulator [Staphylococcus saprophyticus]
MKDLGDFIKKTRQKYNLSATKLEQLSHVSKSYIYKIENGLKTEPKDEILVKLAFGFGRAGANSKSVLEEMVSKSNNISQDILKELNDILLTIEYEFAKSKKSIDNLSYMLADKKNNLEYTINIYNQTYTVELNNNIKSSIKSVLDEIVKMHIFNNPELLKNNTLTNEKVDYSYGINKLKIMEDRAFKDNEDSDN